MAKNGGILGQVNLPSNSSAPGRWGIKQAYTAIKENNWPGIFSIEYLVIAGGGSGAARSNTARAMGGGGAGGYRCSVTGENSGGGASAETPLSISIGSSFTVTVGAGGAGVSQTNSGLNGNAGSISVFSSITSVGGGRGSNAAIINLGNDGGSGGGAGVIDTVSGTGGSGTTGQGFNGGNSFGSSTTAERSGGGGGGAGQSGANGTSTTAGNGGNGVSSSITGSSVTRSGGGGGTRTTFVTAGTSTGGSGGGSGGIWSSVGGANQTSSNGTANTGSGSGGAVSSGSTSTATSGNGGSGVVIARLQEGYDFTSIDPGLTYLTYTAEGKRVYEFTSGTGEVTVGQLSPISYTFIGNYQNISDTNTYTFNSINVGDTGLLVFSFGSEGNGVSADAVSVSADGYPAIEANSVNQSQDSQSIWYTEIPNPLDTTIDVTVNTDQAGLRAVLGVWLISGYLSSTPVFDGSDAGTGSTRSITTITLPAESVVIAGIAERNGGITFSWSGLSEDFDTNTTEGGSSFSGASTKISSSQAVAVSATLSTAGAGSSMVVAAWR
jgi:hypothetical protein